MGYGGQESKDLEAAIDDTDCDTAVIGTPTDPNRVIKTGEPSPGGPEPGLITCPSAFSMSGDTWPLLAIGSFQEVTRGSDTRQL